MTREKKLDECCGDAECILRLIHNDELPEEWESTSVSPHSPGVICESEGIVRFVLSPTHLGEGGEVDLVKVVREAQVVGRGCSVERIAMGDADGSAQTRGRSFVLKTNESRDSDKHRSLHSVMWCECSEIRRIVNSSGERLGVVCDTAKSDNPSHADVIGIRFNDPMAKQHFRLAFFEALSRNVRRDSG